MATAPHADSALVTRIALLFLALCLAPHGARAEAARRPGVAAFVVFGDSQDLVRADAPKLYDGFRRMVDWVLANREAEGIDFVLHVGDAIHHGSRMPLRQECAGPGGACEPSYTWARKDGTRMPCDCLAPFQVEREWARFNAQWQRFDGVLPYAIVRGNHDNHGTYDPDSTLDRRGFDQYYGAEHFRALAGSGLVSTHSDSSGTSHAWRFPLGEREVLVIGATHMFGGPGVRWVDRVLAEQPGVPAIALAHSFFGGLPPRRDRPRRPWQQIVARHPDRFAVAVSGHVSPGRVEIVEVGGRPLLTIRSSWQGRGGEQTTLHLVRLREGSGTVEVVALDPVRRTVDQRPDHEGTTWLPQTPFSLDPPPTPDEASDEASGQDYSR